MRPQGAGGALAAIAVGAILTYAVSFTISGVSIRTAGVIIMIVGAVALGILLVRFVSGSRHPGRPRHPQNTPGPSADGVYRQQPVRGAPPIAATQISTGIYTVPEQRANQPLDGEEGYRAPGTLRH